MSCFVLFGDRVTKILEKKYLYVIMLYSKLIIRFVETG